MTNFFSIIFRLLYWRVCIVKKQEWYFQHGRKHVYWTFWKSLRSRAKISLFLWQAAVQSCSVKKFFSEISQNSQENTCAKFSVFNKEIQKVIWHRCFPVNFVKLLRTFVQNTSGRLLRQTIYLEIRIFHYFLYN